MGFWESVNKITSRQTLAGGDAAVLTLADESQIDIVAIVHRDSAQVMPNETDSGFYEVLDPALGQYRTEIGFGNVDFTPLAITTTVMGGEIEITETGEKFLIEAFKSRDTFIMRVFCTKVVRL